MIQDALFIAGSPRWSSVFRPLSGAVISVFDDWSRDKVVASCALSYPLVWLGAGMVGFVAAITSGVETGTRGLGHLLFGFGVGVVVLSLLWSVFAFLGMVSAARRRGRSAVAAIAAPALVIFCALLSPGLAVACGLLVPYAVCWWATRPSL